MRYSPGGYVWPARRFMELGAASGLALLSAAVVALVWADLPCGESYEEFWGTHLFFEIGPIEFTETLREVVNDSAVSGSQCRCSSSN